MAKKTGAAETAESMAKRQREISVSEFFLKNRHLLGFDSPRKAIMTAVKEAVDNSLDACEEAGILPEISVELKQTAESRFLVTVQDNGPGIVRAQIGRGEAKRIDGLVPPPAPPTAFSLLGHWLTLIWTVLLFAVWHVASRRARR